MRRLALKKVDIVNKVAVALPFGIKSSEENLAFKVVVGMLRMALTSPMRVHENSYHKFFSVFLPSVSYHLGDGSRIHF